MIVTKLQRQFKAKRFEVVETERKGCHPQAPSEFVAIEQVSAFDGNELEEFLHDFVVQDLVALSLNLELLVGRANSLIGRIRDVVDHGEQSAATLERVIQIASASFDGLATRAIHVHPASNMLLDRELLLDVSCVIREAVSNAVRHGEATTVIISAEIIGGNLLLEVSDDGCGVDEGAVGVGNGTRNITARATRRGGDCRIVRKTDGGTKVTWKVPTKENRND
jgi:signal transduction histidine kinase